MAQQEQRTMGVRERQAQAASRRAQEAASRLVEDGWEEDRAREAAEAGTKAAAKVSENKSVFALREWGEAFGKAAGQGWLDDPAWGGFRAVVARAVGLIPLAEAKAGEDWSMWAPAEHLKAEEEMVELAKRLDGRHRITEEMAKAACDARPSMEPEQRAAAIASCVGDKAVVVTEGTAGAGKSYTLEAIKEVYENAPPEKPGGEKGYEIVGTALSWTAAKVLQQSAKLDQAQALAGLLIEMDKAKEAGGSFFKRRALVVVDEAGLVGTMKMRALLRHAAQAPVPVRVLLTGDSLQLNPVEAGNALEAIVEACGSSRLDVIRRQARESHKSAVKHFSQGRAELGLWTYWQQEALWVCPSAEERLARVMSDYVEKTAAHPMDACLVLALSNEDVKLLNEGIRERLKAVGLLAGEEHELTVNNGAGPYKARFCVGDRVVLRKNLREQPVHESRHKELHEGAAAAKAAGAKEAAAGFFARAIGRAAGSAPEPLGEEVRKGVFNRSAGIVMGIRPSPSGKGDRLVRLLLNEGGEVEIDTAQLRDPYAEKGDEGIAMHHNFATTIYASQGQTVQRVLLLDSPYMNRRLAYVGMSRHKLECDVYADGAELTKRRRARGARDLKFAWGAREKAKAKEMAEAESFEEGDLLAEMALCWNKESKNPTVTQMMAQMRAKREKAAKEGSATGRLRQAEGDDPDDEQAGAPAPWADRPASYAELMRARGASKPAKAGFFESLLGGGGTKAAVEPAREPAAAPAESRELPAWSAEPLAAKALAELEGIAWGRSRWGFPRLFALDKEGRKVARWTFGGRCVAGRREPPALPNAPGSPWMVVAGPREALMSWAHFTKKWEAQPERAPSIAVAFEGADLSALRDWVAPGQSLHCAWSPKDPASLEWAKAKAEELAKLGFKASVYPKEPRPGAVDSAAPEAKRPGAKP